MVEMEKSSKKRAAKHIATYATGNILRQLAGFIMLPIYTSYLSPADYGVVGLLLVMVAIFELTMGARFAQSIPKFYYEQDDEYRRHSLISTALFLTGVISVFTTLLIAFNSSAIGDILLGSSDYSAHVAVFGFTLLTTALEAYGLTFFRLQEKPLLFVTNSVSKLIVQLSLNIALVVFLDMGVMGVVVSNLIASTLFGLFAAGYILWHTGIKFDRAWVSTLFGFSWPLWLAGLAGLYVGSSNRIFIRVFSTLDDVGLFELAWKFAAILPLLVWRPFAQWWQTERFKLYQKSDQGVSTFPVVFNATSMVLIYVAAGICLFNGPVIYYMSDSAFHTAALAVPILVLGILFESLSSFFFFSFLAKGKTLFITYIRYASGIVITIGCVSLIPYFGFVGAAIAYAISNLFVLIVSFLWSKRVFDSGIKMGFCVRIIFVAAALLVLESYLVTGNMIIQIGLKALAALVIFGLFLAMARKDRYLAELYAEATKFLREKLKNKTGKGYSG